MMGRASYKKQTNKAAAYWQTVYERNPEEQLPAIRELAPLTTDLSSITIIPEQVQAAIASTQPRAPGPDGLSIALLRLCAAELAGPLAVLFTRALHTELPAVFKRGKTIFLPKSTGRATSPLQIHRHTAPSRSCPP